MGLTLVPCLTSLEQVTLIDCPERGSYYVGLGKHNPGVGVKVTYVGNSDLSGCASAPGSSLACLSLCVTCRCALNEVGKFAYAPPGVANAKRLNAGDIVGVGVMSTARCVFYSINGDIQPYVHQLKDTKAEMKGLCPIIAGWSGLLITANFGQAEFATKVSTRQGWAPPPLYSWCGEGQVCFGGPGV